MKRGKLIIFDREEEYARALLEHMRKKNFPVSDCMIITKEEILEEYLRDNRAELLIAAENEDPQYEHSGNINHMILLSEGRLVRENSQYPVIYKYQSMELILQEIISCYSSFGGDEIAFTYAAGHGKKIITVYSPSSGMARTMFAITLAKAYAEQKETLYLPFEAFPVENTLDEKGGMSDLIYYLKERSQHVGMKIQTMAHQNGKLSYIAPVSHFKDAAELSAPEYLSLVRELRENSPYEIIIIEAGHFDEHIMQLMAASDQVFLPYEEVGNQGMVFSGSGEAGRIHAFRKMLLEEGMENILGRMQAVPIPMADHDWNDCRERLAAEYADC